jgi:hypothetical protein
MLKAPDQRADIYAGGVAADNKPRISSVAPDIVSFQWHQWNCGGNSKI